MFQIVLALVAIGLALFLWQVFPAFKWVVAVIIAVPIIWLTAELANDKIHQMNVAKQEAQEAKDREIAGFEETKLKLKEILARIDAKEQSGQKLSAEDLGDKAQVKLWLEQVEKNEADYKVKH
jgi:divalent metal cation (Fe/Co/Zn/Cd) transporter